MRPSILFLDIETAPDVVWVWGVYQQNAISVKENWYVLSYAAKWADSDAWVRGLDDFKGYVDGDSTEAQLLEEIWRLLDQADIVVAHNGADFDVKKLNARFIEQGFLPPSPYKVVDTKRDLVRTAKFSSHRLDWLAKQFHLGAKIPTDFSLWQGCMDGDPNAWKKMKAYNLHDVVLLEKLYKLIAPWIDQPNAGVYTEERVCPNPSCKSGSLERRGFAYAKTRVYQRYRCRKCGTWSRSVASEKGFSAKNTRL
jgi:hypothetical protein